MRSSLMKSIVSGRNSIDADGSTQKSRQARAPDRLAAGNPGRCLLLCEKRLDEINVLPVSVESLAPGAVLPGVRAPGNIVRTDLAHGPDAPGLPAGPARMPAYLSGLGVRALYSGQRVACDYAYFVGGQVWCAAPRGVCQYDRRADYEARGRRACLRGQPAILERHGNRDDVAA